MANRPGRVFRGIHYQEAIHTDAGDLPDSEIHEVTVELPDGGFETYQQVKRYLLGCDHIGTIARLCRCGRSCCDKCRCRDCQRGTCRECSVRLQTGETLCKNCMRVLEGQIHEATVESFWTGLLRWIGLVE